MNAGKKQISRRGMSLVELLVILFIIGLITALTIPAVKPALDGRELREGARMVGAMLGSAQTRAISTGRPCGVWFERLSTAPDASLLMYLAETPSPWAGSVTNSCAYVSNGSVVRLGIPQPPQPDPLPDDPPPGMIHNNDLIQFNNQGRLYRIWGSSGNANNEVAPPSPAAPWRLYEVDPFLAQFYNATGRPTAVNYQNPVPYKIIRQPVRSSSPPMQLPGSVAVDLAWSGYSDISFRDMPPHREMAQNALLVMFSKTGTLEGVYHSGGEFHAPSGALYLLIGKREKLVNIGGIRYGSYDYVASDDTETKLSKHNWLDTNNFWLSINYQTGLVSTAKVANPNNETNGLPVNLQASRAYARDAQSIGGQ